MPNILTVKASRHRIDLNQESIGERTPINEGTDFDAYAAKLLKDMYESSRYKSFKFSSGETEVARQVLSLNANTWVDNTQVIAERLLRIEKVTQERMQRITNLRPGSLVQILVEVNGQRSLIITKVDHNSFLDDINLLIMNGLPIDQRAQKTAIISFEDEMTVSDIKLSDTNNKISEYWWKDFLEVEELESSEKNTLKAFNAIDQALNKVVRDVSKSDYWTLRNAVISYFRTNDSCVFDVLISSVFENYHPDNSELNMDKLKQNISVLPEKYKFDSQFEISPTSIKARIKNQIKLAENLELKFTGDVTDLPNLIDTGEADDGRKYIRIFSETGYNEFNRDW